MEKENMFEDDEVIFVYTRNEAIMDGTLIDVTETAREAGFRWPVAVTCAVWNEYVRVPVDVIGQDESGRLWDILWMLITAIRRETNKGRVLVFHVMVRNELNRSTVVALKAISGPDDDGEPCLTVMLPEED
jgi:hypothetical protein